MKGEVCYRGDETSGEEHADNEEKSLSFAHICRAAIVVELQSVLK
jgi:hypothetical protein